MAHARTAANDAYSTMDASLCGLLLPMFGAPDGLYRRNIENLECTSILRTHVPLSGCTTMPMPRAGSQEFCATAQARLAHWRAPAGMCRSLPRDRRSGRGQARRAHTRTPVHGFPLTLPASGELADSHA